MKSESFREENFIKITNYLTVDNFEKIKNYILEKGDKQTYRNYDNDNPHYRFEAFDVYLGSDRGQKNISNNPKLSNFNELTIRGDQSYYKIVIVRKGDIAARKQWIIDEMQENEVYLLNYRKEKMDEVPTELINIIEYILKMKETAANRGFTPDKVK